MSQPYPQQPPRQQYGQQYPPPPPPAPAPPTRARTSKLAVVALVVGLLNLLLTAYLVFVVIRAQSALAELGNAFSNLPGGLGG